MDFSEWTNRLGILIQILESERAETMLKNVADMLALVQARIINERENVKGGSFGTYSDAVVPFWFYRGKDTRRNNQTAVDDLYYRVGYFASYQDWREVNNLTGDQINFSFTGEMWKSMKPIILQDKSGVVVIGWVLDDPEKDRLMGFHLGRFPDLLDLNARELKIMDTLNQQRLDSAFKRAGLT